MVTGGEAGRVENEQAKGGQYVVTEGDWTLGGEHTMQYRNGLLQNCICGTYIMLLTNVSPVNVI